MCEFHLCSCSDCGAYLEANKLIPQAVEQVIIPGMEGCIFCSLNLGKLTPELVLAEITNSYCNKCELDAIISEYSPKPYEPVRIQNAERFLRCSDCANGYICSPRCGCPPDCVCVVPKQCAKHDKRRHPVRFT